LLESDAAIAFEEKLANDAAALEDELFCPGVALAPEALDIGVATERLPSQLLAALSSEHAEELNFELKREDVKVIDADTLEPTAKPSLVEALIALVEDAAVAAKVAANPAADDTKVAPTGVLEAWQRCIFARWEEQEGPLPRSCCAQLLRFVELAEQRRVEAREVPDFGGGDSDEDDEDEEEKASGSDAEQPDEAVGAFHDVAVVPGSSAPPTSDDPIDAADVGASHVPGGELEQIIPGSTSPQVDAPVAEHPCKSNGDDTASAEMEIKMVPEGAAGQAVVAPRRKRVCCSVQ
jgi:hypothetical protein